MNEEWYPALIGAGLVAVFAAWWLAGRLLIWTWGLFG